MFLKVPQIMLLRCHFCEVKFKVPQIMLWCCRGPVLTGGWGAKIWTNTPQKKTTFSQKPQFFPFFSEVFSMLQDALFHLKMVSWLPNVAKIGYLTPKTGDQKVTSVAFINSSDAIFSACLKKQKQQQRQSGDILKIFCRHGHSNISHLF